MNELIVAEQIDPVHVFDGKNLDPLLQQIREKATSVVSDVDTGYGRKQIRTIAHKVAQSKVILDNAGKELVAGWKEKAKAVDSERKKAREFLDALKVEIRQPLTEYEEAKKAHEDEVKGAIKWFAQCAQEYDEDGNYFSSAALKQSLESVEATDAPEEYFGEWTEEAARQKQNAIETLKRLITKRMGEEFQAAEFAKLQAEMEQRKAAEQEAQARQAAEDLAKKRAAEAVEAERLRVENEKRAAAEAQAKREADEAHRAKINCAAANALITLGLSEEDAKAAIAAIVKGMVPNVTISY